MGNRTQNSFGISTCITYTRTNFSSLAFSNIHIDAFFVFLHLCLLIYLSFFLSPGWFGKRILIDVMNFIFQPHLLSSFPPLSLSLFRSHSLYLSFFFLSPTSLTFSLSFSCRILLVSTTLVSRSIPQIFSRFLLCPLLFFSTFFSRPRSRSVVSSFFFLFSSLTSYSLTLSHIKFFFLCIQEKSFCPK